MNPGFRKINAPSKTCNHMPAFPFNNGPKHEKTPLLPAYYVFFKLCCIPPKLENFYNSVIFLPFHTMRLPLCTTPQNLHFKLHTHGNFTYFSAEYVNPFKPSLHLKHKNNRFFNNGLFAIQHKVLWIKYYVGGLRMNTSFSLTTNSTSVTTLWLCPTSQLSPRPWDISETKGTAHKPQCFSLLSKPRVEKFLKDGDRTTGVTMGHMTKNCCFMEKKSRWGLWQINVTARGERRVGPQ